MRTVALALLVSALGLPAVAGAEPAAPPQRFHYDVPVLADSPWPQMRRDSRNSAFQPLRGERRPADEPWSYRTRRGIFSTPVIGEDETVYVGSADTGFYALDRNGARRWRFDTGGIIDAAAALGARLGGGEGFPITVGSGDETLYQLRSKGGLSRKQRIRWKFRTELPPATGQLVNWWEGNPAYGPDGNLYVGNTGGGAFSLTPGGEQRWVVQRDNSVWTTPAFDAQGNSYWGSVDFFAFSLDPEGELRWQTFTPGYVTSSPALGSDGTVYVGSFDRNLYALDPDTGAVRWSFPTADHIYSSPALGRATDGDTEAIFIGSADGSVYAVAPDGRQLWSYDTGEPIRSSPVVGRAPHGGRLIVYVGSSNGKLYALDSDTGERRWSFDTTPGGRLADRNDLNGSPALGRRGVYIGGEHGRVWFVPYVYCRNADDRRCERQPGDEFEADLQRVYPVTPGGTTLSGSKQRVPASTVLAARLVVRRDGRTVDATIDPGAGSDALVSARPGFDFQTQLSGDGHYLFIRPDGILAPATEYRVRVAGDWTAEGDSGSFETTLRFRSERSRGGTGALAVERDRVGALELRRLALPLPSLLPSVNQIGFDSYDLIAGTLARDGQGKGRGRALLWVIGGRPGKDGTTVPDPDGGFAFPLFGPYRGDALALNSAGVGLEFSFGTVPVRSFDVRGRLARGGDGLRAGASLYAQVTCADVPNYSAQLRVAGVCNDTDTLAAYGTLLSEGYDERGGANLRPRGVRAGEVALTPPSATADGEASVAIRVGAGKRYRAAKHLVSILLTDAATGAPVALDYRTLTTPTIDAAGNVAAVSLRIPAGTELPPDLRAYVIADVFPLAVSELGP